MELDYREQITAEDYNKLREAVGWGALCREQAQLGLDHSALVVSCRRDGEIAGCARLLWDHGYMAYIADVMVMPECQGQGIGRAMIERILAFLRAQIKEGWRMMAVLVATEGREPFYRKLGFRERPCEGSGAGMDFWLA